MKIRVSPKEGFTLIELLVVISIIAILAGIALPAFTGVIERGNQTKVLSNAKQIYLGLKMFAGDYDGAFPSRLPDTSLNNGTLVAPDAGANGALRNLVPNYVPTEKVFWQPKDGFCSNTPPDDDHSVVANILDAGSNHFAYVRGLNDTSPPAWPILAEGFANATTAVYSKTPGAQGGIWKGSAAIAVRVDGSAKVERLTLGENPYIEDHRGQATRGNIFLAASGQWLDNGNTTEPVLVLNPLPAGGGGAGADD